MQEHNSFTNRYKVLLILTFIALMALVIFVMNISMGFRIGLLIASAVILVWMLHSSEPEEPPCGAAVDIGPIARPPGIAHEKK